MTWRDKIVKGRALGRKIGTLSAEIVSRCKLLCRKEVRKRKLDKRGYRILAALAVGNESKDVRVEMHNCGVSAASCASMCKNVSLFQRRANLICIFEIPATRME